ncbi:hypothetical protein [Massilia oculi]|uniref:hypothetical protein n=1 Tax=Massilia oculi TaxID=945844 RepID=UPI0028AC1C1E|nr:hypothetical protein [Massilia oculi]
MNNIPAVLHFSTGFPVLIGLHHVQDYASVKGADESSRLIVRKPNGEIINAFGIVHGNHHYIIATRPRCMIDESNFQWIPSQKCAVGYLEFETKYKEYKKVPFRLCLDGRSPYPFLGTELFRSVEQIEDAKVERSCFGYPNRIVFTTQDGIFGFYLEPDLLHFIEIDDSNHPGILDFKIQYIGISTGAKGNRDFADRLWNHEKIREISGLIQRDSPNLQVYIFGYKAGYVIEAFPNHFIVDSKIIESTIGMFAWAQVLEAALIRKFQPEHNKDLKNFLISEYPHWLPDLKNILVPNWEGGRPSKLSTTIASDCRHNSSGSWVFGRFYTDTVPAQDLFSFELDLN